MECLHSSTGEEISSDGEVAHTCFMAKSNEVSSLDNIDDFSIDKLFDTVEMGREYYIIHINKGLQSPIYRRTHT